MAENAGQADDGERAVLQFDLVGPGEAFQSDGLRCVLDGDLPQLTVTCAVQLARATERAQLLGSRFDTATFLADQKQLASGQSRGQCIEQVVGQVTRLGQEQHRGFKGGLWRFDAEIHASFKTCVQGRLITGVPAPSTCVRQFSEQVIGGQPDQQQRALKQLGLTE